MALSQANIQAKRQQVNAAYSEHGFHSSQYQKSFDELHDMNMSFMADQFRKALGLPPGAKTPYRS